MFKTFFPKIVFVYEIMWKQNSTGGQYNTAHLRCMLGIQGYKHTFTICNDYCSSTTRVFARTRHTVSFV